MISSGTCKNQFGSQFRDASREIAWLLDRNWSHENVILKKVIPPQIILFSFLSGVADNKWSLKSVQNIVWHHYHHAYVVRWEVMFSQVCVCSGRGGGSTLARTRTRVLYSPTPSPPHHPKVGPGQGTPHPVTTQPFSKNQGRVPTPPVSSHPRQRQKLWFGFDLDFEPMTFVFKLDWDTDCSVGLVQIFQLA